MLFYLNFCFCSSVEFINNLECILNTKYTNEDFLYIENDIKNYNITIYIKKKDQDCYEINWIKHTSIFSPQEIDFIIKSDDQILLPENIDTLLIIPEHTNIYFNLILESKDYQIENLHNRMIEQIKEKCNSMKNSIFLKNFCPINTLQDGIILFTVNLQYNKSKIFYHIVLKRDSGLFLFSFDTQNQWNNIIIEDLKGSSAFNEDIIEIVAEIFKDFDFLTYGQLVADENVDEILIDLMNVSDNESEEEIVKFNFEKAFLRFADFLQKFNLHDRMKNEINQLYLFFKGLNEDNIRAIVILYYSLPPSVKNIVINRILDSSNSLDSLLIYWSLTEHNYISEEERDLMCAINLSYDHFDSHIVGQIFTKNNPYRHNVYIKLKNLKIKHLCEIMIFIAGIICKTLDYIYINQDDTNPNYKWKDLYDKIFLALNIKKEKYNFLLIFNNVIQDHIVFKHLTNLKTSSVLYELGEMLEPRALLYKYTRGFTYSSCKDVRNKGFKLIYS